MSLPQQPKSTSALTDASAIVDFADADEASAPAVGPARQAHGSVPVNTLAGNDIALSKMSISESINATASIHPSLDQTHLKPRASIVGRVGLQNTLLCKTLSQELGIVCDLATDKFVLPTVPAFALHLLDVERLGLESIIDYLDLSSKNDATASIALFNLTQADDKMLEERYLGWPTLQGVFLRNCDPATLVNGVRSILAGHVCLPRRYLERFLSRYRDVPANNNPAGCGRRPQGITLTRKEQLVLTIMLDGCTNLQIAQQLSISPHTVKTHIYNLYKKLKVANRIEAVMWGRRHLASFDSQGKSI